MKILLEEKILGKQSKNGAKYYWVLESIIGKNEDSENFTDYFPSSSEKGYIQDVKEEILEKINSENIFSFPYTPKEGDYLSIKNNLRKQEYLNLIFINNNWVEEIFMCTYRECDTDIYTTIKTGVAFLTQDI
ncbi:hypothetical protein C1637_08180 [Chryseobacterium lactis]|uniref:DUF3805 domain-containing protein n=1 Tax=Chryseobacterium lactis TaxID=1241981 RepID=A0A3G6RIU0_CHRLC|nr:hypothetical protein [Chryseobacterium lactis]AZA82485.1 hypothetical protein EG342_11515 [Chryseobacterium lactis]AZB02867.1 hypothetical protein EG341_02375 [Chryseobacterium lactis]PNW13839.1 hypothetical protein C1637_08180 [Chryseobacterium lactis]